MIETTKYVRKPLYVDAVQVTEENFQEIANWCQGQVFEILNSSTRVVLGVDIINPGEHFIKVRVHNPRNARQGQAYVGDWILYTKYGYKIYTEQAFVTNFDAAEETGNPDQFTMDAIEDARENPENVDPAYAELDKLK